MRLLSARRLDLSEPVHALLAVSGGGDSLSMLLHAARAAPRLANAGLSFGVATVDHGLRPEAAQEAETVAALSRDLGLPHTILRWRGWDGRGNPSEQAREARYRLLADAARDLGALAVVTAHTQGDQLETVLMRRDRGERHAAGMREARDLAPGIALLRPFLFQSRAMLHAVLATERVRPALDPTNEDRHYARIRARDRVAAMGAAERLALMREIGEAEGRRAAADRRVLLSLRALLASRDANLPFERGEIRFDAAALRSLDATTRRRILARALTAAGGALHPPSAETVRRLDGVLFAPSTSAAATAGDAQVRMGGGAVLFRREYGRTGLGTLPVPSGSRHLLFDRRFDIEIAPDTAEEGGRVLAFGATGRGNETERTLPMLVGADASPIAAHPLLLAKAGAGTRPLAAASRVRWRLFADLADREIERRTAAPAPDRPRFDRQR